MKLNKYKTVKVIAHRGNSLYAPENTKTAFKQAVDLGVDFIECDVQLSKDGIPLVIHDGCFSRMTQNTTLNKVDALNYSEIKNLDAGSWFNKKYAAERIMTLDEFFLMQKKGIGMMIDVKEETVTNCELALKIGQSMKKYTELKPGHGPILIGSLNVNVLTCFDGYLPEQNLIPIVSTLDELAPFHFLRAKVYALEHTMVNEAIVRELHERGAEVWTWVVDDLEVAKKMSAYGVDGIITNAPKNMQMLLRQEKLMC
ncbi:MAG: glycerophosphodiester phosphodiesterase family protein [Chlamydiota bacterium]|nr:glycerophosphodiester phosphodiesterase family protein [Chlamydiota bacterium]